MTDIAAALSAMDSNPAPSTEPVSTVPSETEIDQLRKQLAEKESQLTSKFDGLTRRERALLQREQELKQKFQNASTFDELRSLAEKDPLKALEKLNLTYDKLTDIYAGMSPQDEGKAQAAKFQTELEQLKQKIQEQEAEGQMKEIMRVKGAKLEALKNLANKENSDYSLVSYFNSYEDVLEHMAAHFQETGEILSDEDALNHVESRLVESLRGLKENKKLRSLWESQEQVSVGQKPVSPFSLSDSKLKTETPKTEDTKGLTDSQLFELALQKLPR
jgi:hypothetical protein